MRNRFTVLLVGLALAATVGQLQASITSGSVTGGTAFTGGGIFVQLTPPLPVTIGLDNFNTNNLYGFNEDQNITLDAVLNVDVGSGPIAAGTIVASHYIFFDPLQANIVGTVNFDSKILGIMTSNANLVPSDVLANTGVNYLSPNLRGLEPDEDTITISGPTQISISWSASSPGDYIRVITEFSPAATVSSLPALASVATPEPGMLTIWCLGALGGAVAAYRRNILTLERPTKGIK